MSLILATRVKTKYKNKDYILECKTKKIEGKNPTFKNNISIWEYNIKGPRKIQEFTEESSKKLTKANLKKILIGIVFK